MFILTRVLLYDKLLSQLIENKIKNKCSLFARSIGRDQ